MRILMLSQFYAPYIGGEERHVQDLSRELSRRGHQVAVATLGHPGLAEYEEDGGVRIYRLRGSMQRLKGLFSDPTHRHAPPFPDPEAVLALQKVVSREKPDIVHAHNWLIHSYLPLKPLNQARLVLTLHDYSLVCAKKKLIHRGLPCQGPGAFKCFPCAADHYGSLKGIPTLMANRASRLGERALVDLFLAVSRSTAAGNGLVGSGLPYKVIPNFIPDELAADGAGTPPTPPDGLPSGGFLLFVGALGGHKGVDVLLRAYEGLGQAPPLVLIGYETAEYPVPLENLPGQVIVRRNWPHDRVMQAWQSSLMGIAPSTCLETFGLVALEAMASGRPMVASNLGGLTDLVIDGQNGYLVPPGDAQALRQAIERLLANPRLREQMGQAGKRQAAAFTASAVVPQIEAAYREVLEGKPRKNPTWQEGGKTE